MAGRGFPMLASREADGEADLNDNTEITAWSSLLILLYIINCFLAPSTRMKEVNTSEVGDRLIYY